MKIRLKNLLIASLFTALPLVANQTSFAQQYRGSHAYCNQCCNCLPQDCRCPNPIPPASSGYGPAQPYMQMQPRNPNQIAPQMPGQMQPRNPNQMPGQMPGQGVQNDPFVSSPNTVSPTLTSPNGFAPPLGQGITPTQQSFSDQGTTPQINATPFAPEGTGLAATQPSAADAAASLGADTGSAADIDFSQFAGGSDAGADQSATPNMLGNSFGAGSNQSLITIGQFGVGQPGVSFDSLGSQLSSLNASPNLRFGTGLTIDNLSGDLIATRVVSPLVVQADLLDSRGLDRYGILPNSGIDLAAQSVGEDVFGGGSTVYRDDLSGVQITGMDGSGNDVGSFAYAYDYVTQVNIPSPGNGTTVGRIRLADNSSAQPKDRIFVDFNYFNNVPLFEEVDVRRMTPGVERTFNNRLLGNGSFEVRLPMALTLNSSVLIDGANESDYTEFGNLHLRLKRVIRQTRQMTTAVGVSLDLPTADDFKLGFADGTELITVDNESVHVVPYIAFLFNPSDRFFAHAFFQADFDTTGSSTYINTGQSGTASFAGKWQDPATMLVDLSAGSWLFRNRQGRGPVTGAAVMTELHYATAMQDADVIRAGNFAVGNAQSQVDLLDATVGLHLQLGPDTSVTAGYSAPLQEDRVFDGEARLSVNQLIRRANRR